MEEAVEQPPYSTLDKSLKLVNRDLFMNLFSLFNNLTQKRITSNREEKMDNKLFFEIFAATIKVSTLPLETYGLLLCKY